MASGADPQTEGPRRHRRKLGIALLAVALAGLVAFALSRLNLSRAGHALITANPGWIALSLLLMGPLAGTALGFLATGAAGGPPGQRDPLAAGGAGDDDRRDGLGGLPRPHRRAHPCGRDHAPHRGPAGAHARGGRGDGLLADADQPARPGDPGGRHLLGRAAAQRQGGGRDHGGRRADRGRDDRRLRPPPAGAGPALQLGAPAARRRRPGARAAPGPPGAVRVRPSPPRSRRRPRPAGRLGAAVAGLLHDRAGPRAAVAGHARDGRRGAAGRQRQCRAPGHPLERGRLPGGLPGGPGRIRGRHGRGPRLRDHPAGRRGHHRVGARRPGAAR